MAKFRFGTRRCMEKSWKEEGRGAKVLERERKRKAGAGSRQIILPAPSLLRSPLSGHPLEMFRGTTCSTTYPVPWKRIAAQNFRNQPNNRAGFSQLFRNEEDSTMSNPNYELTCSVNSIILYVNIYEMIIELFNNL